MSIEQNAENTLDSNNQEELDNNQENQPHATSPLNPLVGAAQIVAFTCLFLGAALVGALSVLEARQQAEPDLASGME